MIEPKYMKNLELDKVLAMLAELTCCETAREKALSIQPLTEKDEVQREIDRTSDLFQLTVRFGDPDLYDAAQSRWAAENRPVGRHSLMQRPAGHCRCFAAGPYPRPVAQPVGREENAVSEQFSRLYLNNPLEREISSAIISEDALDDNASLNSLPSAQNSDD